MLNPFNDRGRRKTRRSILDGHGSCGTGDRVAGAEAALRDAASTTCSAESFGYLGHDGCGLDAGSASTSSRPWAAARAANRALRSRLGRSTRACLSPPGVTRRARRSERERKAGHVRAHRQKLVVTGASRASAALLRCLCGPGCGPVITARSRDDSSGSARRSRRSAAAQKLCGAMSRTSPISARLAPPRSPAAASSTSG